MPGLHIRYNETLKQYESSTTGTDQGPWAKLDLSSHSAAIPANIAFTNIDNAWSAAQQLPSFSAIRGTNSVLWIKGTQASPEPKHWRFLTYDNGHMYAERFSSSDVYMGGGPIFLNDGGISTPGPASFPTVTVTSGIISFPVAQNASTAGNHLDDYEEGSFTPYLTSGAGAPTYTDQYGRYVKIGRTVTVSGRIMLSSRNTMLDGNIQMLYLPFMHDSNLYGTFFVAHWMGAIRTDIYGLGGLLFPNTATCDFRFSSGLTGIQNLVTADIGNSFDIIFSATYLTDS